MLVWETDLATKKRLKRKKKKLYFLKKEMLKTKATLKTMEKLFATTMVIFVFLLAQNQNPIQFYIQLHIKL